MCNDEFTCVSAFHSLLETLRLYYQISSLYCLESFSFSVSYRYPLSNFSLLTGKDQPLTTSVSQSAPIFTQFYIPSLLRPVCHCNGSRRFMPMMIAKYLFVQLLDWFHSVPVFSLGTVEWPHGEKCHRTNI